MHLLVDNWNKCTISGCNFVVKTSHLQNVSTFRSLSSEKPHILTYLLTSCNTVLEKPTGSQLVKKFPTFYGTPRLITAVKNARHLTLTWASSIQSIPLHPTTRRSILILSSHLRLGLPSGVLPSGFPNKTLYTFVLFTTHATFLAHLLLDFITRTILGKEYRSLSSSLGLY